MADLGNFALLLALLTAAYAIITDVLGAWRNQNALTGSGRNATIASCFCLTVAIVSLAILLVRRDFSVSYVAQHTSRALPLMYRLSALWAGAAGSLLFWLWLQAGFIVLCFCKSGENKENFLARARAIANIVGVYFILVLVLDKNPFTLSSAIGADGAGLNPLLQHPAMVLHPPTLFAGYAALAIPFAWAFASLRHKDENGPCPLFAQVRKWTLFAWLFLTIGIVLGAWWAYEELGWGGYWAWDPVENSSLLPWLTATALLHRFRIHKANSPISGWLTVPAIVTFSLCIFGTFLTRYGLIASVHAFGESGLGILFLVLLVNIWAIAAVLLWRKHRDKIISSEEKLLPAEKFIVLNSWLMVLLAAVIFTGMLFPFFSGLFSEYKIALMPDSFTKITAPFSLAILLLLGLCPHRLGRGITNRRRIFAAVFFAAAAVAVWLITKGLAIPCFILCGFAAAGLAVDFISCKRRTADACQAQSHSPRTLRWYGAGIVHISVVLIFVGIAGSGGYATDCQAVLKPGQSIKVGKFDIKYDGLKADLGPNFTAVTADISVSSNGKFLGRLNPSQAVYYAGQTRTSEVDIRRTLSGDLYIALTAADAETGLANLRVMIKPLINFIWIGAAGLVLGAFLVLVCPAERKV